MRGNFHKRGNIYQSNIWLLHIRPTHTQVMKQITTKKPCFLTPDQKNTNRLSINDQRHVTYHFHLWSILTSRIIIWNIFLWSTSKAPQTIWAEWGWFRLNQAESCVLLLSGGYRNLESTYWKQDTSGNKMSLFIQTQPISPYDVGCSSAFTKLV